MSWANTVWETVSGPFWRTGKVSQEQVEEAVRQARERMPTPVFWLLGKTQSGKTSLIRALTGSTNAEIGNGIRPCTRTASLYPFPADGEPLLQFLDTRGLGEVAYDPSEDVELFQDQAHLLIVVCKALDHAQGPVIDALKAIRKQRPNWPLIVAQTTLHEGYPSPEFEHLEPYPYDHVPLPVEVPENLARSLKKQRELFAGMNARFVPLDFTLPEDGYQPMNYGLDPLWTAIEDVLPLGLRSMFEQTAELRRELRDAYFRAAHPQIISYAVAAGAVSAVPVPLVDVPAVLALQARLMYVIADIYGQPMDSRRMTEIGSALGLSFLGRLGARGLAKMIPGFGSAVAGVYASASTYALGRTLCVYFSHVQQGDVPDPATFRKIYQQQFEEGRQHLAEYIKRMNQPADGSESPQAK